LQVPPENGLEMEEVFRVGDLVEWDSPVGYEVKEENGIVVSHGPVTVVRRGVITQIYDPAPERERLLALLAEGKGYPLYGDWYSFAYRVLSEGVEYCPSPKRHNMRHV
jgi:hypothetical protein